MSSPPPPPPAAATEDEEERTDDEEMDDTDQWEGSESESESEDNDNDVEEEEEEGGYATVNEDFIRGSSAGFSAAVATVVVEEHGADAEAWPTCCICMEPWTSDGAHRICCIPCGHVYGRSCLEKWLHRCGNRSAKCPQCGQRFGHKHITNLHVSGNLWDWAGFCSLRLQELEAQLAASDKKIEQLRVDVRSNEENQELKARLAMANNKLERLMVDIRSEVAQDHAKLKADIMSLIAEAEAKFRAQIGSQFESIQQSSWEESAQDAAAVVQAEFISTKEQMRKMADEQNATPVDLLRFMEQHGAKLWESIRSRRPSPTAATTTIDHTITED